MGEILSIVSVIFEVPVVILPVALFSKKFFIGHKVNSQTYMLKFDPRLLSKQLLWRPYMTKVDNYMV